MRGDHLHEELVVAFLTGRASAGERARVEAHIDACATCRELVSALAATSSAASSSPLPSPESEHGPISDAAISSGTPSLLPGDRVGDRFVLIAHAGKGGMGHVYRARDEVSGAVVALKTMRLADADSELARRFEREARVLEELSDPSVVRYVARGTMADGQAYLVMDWVEGESLALRLRRGPLDVAATLHLVRRIAGGLAAAHARGIVHRDVKPANVLLPDGDVERAVLIDFGIARTQRPGTAATRRGAFLGTPGYMAPEQTRGGGALDARADVFSLGCLAYECLTGAVPFAGTDFLESLAKLLLEAPRPASETAPGVPPALDSLLLRMLAKEPDQRPADAAALLAELASVEVDSLRAPRAAVSIAPPATTSSGRRWRPRRAGSAALAALGLAALVAGGVGFGRARAHRPTTASVQAAGDASAATDTDTASSAPAGDDDTVILVLGIENRTLRVELDGTADDVFGFGLGPAATLDIFTGTDVRARVHSVAPDGERIDEQTARALAKEEHRRVIVVRGSLASRGTGYELRLEVRDPTREVQLLSTVDQPADAASLVQALTDRACEVRHQLEDPSSPCLSTMSSSLEADHELMLGNSLGDSGQFSSALAHYNHALAIDAHFSRARYALAMMLKNMARHTEALQQLDILLRDPGHLSPRTVLLAGFTAHLLRGEFAQAAEVIQAEYDRDPTDPGFASKLSNVHAAMQDWDGALRIARQAVADHPEAAMLRANVLYYELGKGDLPAVQRDGTAFFTDVEAPPPVSFYLAVTDALLGDVAGARAAIAQLTKQAPLVGAHLEADLDASRGDTAGALARLETALAAAGPGEDPEDVAAAWSTVASLKVALGDARGALAAVARTSAATSNHTMWTAARVDIATGHLHEAAALAASLRTSPMPATRGVGCAVDAEIAAARHEPGVQLARAREATALYEGWLSRFELGKALVASGQTDAGRALLEIDRQRPWDACIAFDDLVGPLRDVARVSELAEPRAEVARAPSK